jgi:tRNA (5-methylaminomethyl-2-thiouridylate)-methyltransferase
MKKIKVMMAMSGGVDSSVAAQLLKNQGYDVTGIFLNFWKDEKMGHKAENKCCSLESLLDAKSVANKIGIPLHSFNFAKEFKATVVDNFLEEYAAGRTPNPCVLCNKKIKIGLLLEYAKNMGFDYVATGHYLKIKNVAGERRVYKAKDTKKDQSYFLYTFNQKQLKHLMFPLGGYDKPKVRKLAEKYGLVTAAKPESQDICFLSGPHNDFLKRYLKLKPGPIKLLDTGEEIATHQGLPLYTIGQRRGIEIGGNGPYYVAKIDYETNTLFVVRQWNEDVLFAPGLTAASINWTSGKKPIFPLKCEAVIRYGHAAVPCVVTKGKTKDELEVKFKEPQRAVTPGQSVVFYDKNRMLGGGIIK